MDSPPAGPGVFVTLEGGEGSGKSTLLKEMARRLQPYATVTTTGEPGRSRIGPVLRSLILDDRESPLTPEVEALLLAADRAQHVAEIIRPALARGHIVLCDRYIDSSLAYQGVARALGAQRIADISAWATGNLTPHLTILLDIDPHEGLSRRYSAGGVNRLDREEIAFHNTVRNAFLTLAEQDCSRFLVLPATNSMETNAEHATQETLKRLHLL